jgi:hypothetical protein
MGGEPLYPELAKVAVVGKIASSDIESPPEIWQSEPSRSRQRQNLRSHARTPRKESGPDPPGRTMLRLHMDICERYSGESTS